MYEYESDDKNQNFIGSVLDIVDNSTKEAINEKIKDFIESVDTKRFGRSLLIGASVGIVVGVIVYKIFK